jgi:FAD synthetase
MKENKKIVVASGVFDLVHYGHVRFLEEAKKAGGENAYLIVIVARDKTVIRLKGRKPIIPEDQRRALVESLKPVDEAILGFEDLSFKDAVISIKPDIIAVGHDQTSIAENVRKTITDMDANIQVVSIGRFGLSDLDSSSKIKRKILEEDQ